MESSLCHGLVHGLMAKGLPGVFQRYDLGMRGVLGSIDERHEGTRDAASKQSILKRKSGNTYAGFSSTREKPRVP